MKPRIIAFYLPQFHETPENDEWWGKGFTEWTSVRNAKPLFKGHVQPKVPGELGYYNLLDPIIRERQAELAKEAGIEGFCYWHYWFGNGKRLLEKPFHEVLTSGKPDFPFCLCWANHTWARRTWANFQNGGGKEILMAQTYPGDEDFINHFNTCLPAFKDHRYITVDGKPLFGIWSPFDIPNFKYFKELWNKLALENGLKGIHFVGLCESGVGHNNTTNKVLSMGFDSACPSHFYSAQRRTNYLKQKITTKIQEHFTNKFTLKKWNYKDIIKHWFDSIDREENIYPSIIPNYDRSPRGGVKAVIYYGSTPELFKQHLLQGLSVIKDKTQEHQILFLRSWNEWGEGNYIEPDAQFGNQYLEVTAEVLNRIR